MLAFHGRARDAPRSGSRQTEQAPEPPKPFALPPRHTDARRVYAYLKKRGVSPQIIRSFISAGLLYEDSEHHNCVFVGYDRDGKAAFASLRGTYDRDGSGFKGDAAGSDKSIGFRLPYAPDSRTVYVFEAPIDLMSYCTLHRSSTAMHLPCAAWMTAPLSVFLREHPTVRKVVLCLDHDRPGQEAAERMGRKYAAEGYVVQTLSLPSRKDWNAYLTFVQQFRERGGDQVNENKNLNQQFLHKKEERTLEKQDNQAWPEAHDGPCCWPWFCASAWCPPPLPPSRTVTTTPLRTGRRPTTAPTNWTPTPP